MLVGELILVAWRAITAHKLRSALTVVGVVSVISGLNNYVATKLFSLSPDVYVVSRWGIITSREEFLAAFKRKRIEKKAGSTPYWRSPRSASPDSFSRIRP